MAKKTSVKRVSRSAITGRFVKSPAKAGSVKYRQVDRAVRTVSSRRNGTINSRSTHRSKTQA
jgi:hypothetical protein